MQVKVEPRCVIEALSQLLGVEVLPEKDAENEARIKAEFGDWHAHWQVGLKGARTKNRGKAWTLEDFRKREEALAPLKVTKVTPWRGVLPYLELQTRMRNMRLE